MALKKTSAITICCCAPAHASSSSTTHHLPSFTSSLRSPSYSSSQQQQRPRRLTCRRGYATHQDPGSRSSNQPSQSTPDWPRNPNPTPYEIFDIKRSAPYTKHRFYQLVKLYHPDKHQSSSPSPFSSSSSAAKPISSSSTSSPDSSLPASIRLERYRLVIAANDLLSSPSKRHLYDTHGLGWTPTASPSSHQSHSDLRRADRAWRHSPNSAAHNATWEDWERWHEAQQASASGAANHSRTPLYMSNRLFASLVIALCTVGALAQKSRAESIGDEYVEWKARRHAEIGMELSRRGEEMAGMGREARVDAFVRERENASYHYAPSKYDSIPSRSE